MEYVDGGHPVEVTDELLYRYMPMVDEALMEELESQVDHTYVFSDRFERRMKNLIWREAHPMLNWRYWSAKKAVAALLLLFCVGIGSVMSVEAYRQRFFETIRLVLEDRVSYTYHTEETSSAMRRKELGYVPDGYEEVRRDITDIMFDVIYENECGELITWKQILAADGSGLVRDLEYERQEFREINGVDVEFSIYGSGFISSYFEQGEYVYLLSTENMEIEEICIILENIEDGEK